MLVLFQTLLLENGSNLIACIIIIIISSACNNTGSIQTYLILLLHFLSSLQTKGGDKDVKGTNGHWS